MLENYRFGAGKFCVDFSVFNLTGSDVLSFLQNQSTFNFKLLKPCDFHLTSFLDPQGRIEFYAWAIKFESEVKLLVPLKLKKMAVQRLEKFLISEDVNIEDQGLQNWQVLLGPSSPVYSKEGFFEGTLFEEKAYLTQQEISDKVPALTIEEMNLWRSLNGWPDFSAEGFKPELINNLRLYDLSVSQNKGCYPGQETVAKIATRRGAAFSPVLLASDSDMPIGPIVSFEKKIGEISACFFWEGKYYGCANLLRDFRVAGLAVNFLSENKNYSSIVRYYPLLSGSLKDKAQELYYAGTDAFRDDDLQLAESQLRHAIELDPTLADAYESLGVMLGRLDRYSEAIELMNKLSEVDPSSVLAHTNKSLFLMKLGRIEEAEQEKSLATIKSFQKFGEEAKSKDFILQELKAQEEEWLKREGMFKQVLEIDEEDTLANYGLGSIAVERKIWDVAVFHLEKVLKADPQYSVAYLALGKAYKGLGQKEKASNIWKEGILISAKKGDLMPANQMQSEISNL